MNYEFRAKSNVTSISIRANAKQLRAFAWNLKMEDRFVNKDLPIFTSYVSNNCNLATREGR